MLSPDLLEPQRQRVRQGCFGGNVLETRSLCSTAARSTQTFMCRSSRLDCLNGSAAQAGVPVYPLGYEQPLRVPVLGDGLHLTRLAGLNRTRGPSSMIDPGTRV